MSITVNCAIDLTEEELLLVLMNRYYIEQYKKKEASGALCVDDVNNLRMSRGTVPGMAEVIATADHDRYEAAMDAAEETAAKGNETPDSVSIPPTPNVTFNSPEPEVIPVEPPPLPPKPTRSRAKANGAEAPINATPLAPPPPPEPLDEPAMRSLLSKVGAVHPLKVKAITNLLEAHGGKRRLSECDPSTWPAIAEAALVALKDHSA